MEATQFIIPFLTVTGIQMLGLMSPGPDFAVVSKMAIGQGRRIGVYTAAGIALGISVHVTYSLAGVGYIMTQSILLFNAIKYIGASYLVYIGIKALFHKSSKTTKGSENGEASEEAISAPVVLATPKQAIRTGFLTNVLNPKATLFMFSLFTQVIDPSTPFVLQLAYAVMIVSTTFGWFTFVSFLWSHPFVSKRIKKIQPLVERGMGAVLIALGIKIMLPHTTK